MEVCKIMFTLFHGQSSVERGFMVNKQFSIENLKGKSLIAQVVEHMSTSKETSSKQQRYVALRQRCQSEMQRRPLPTTGGERK